MAKMNKNIKKSLQALPSMGMAFIVLGVLLLAASFAFSIKGNVILFAGLFFIIAGVAGFIYSIKKRLTSHLGVSLFYVSIHERGSFQSLLVMAAYASSLGVINLYPLPWILIISIWSSSFKCLRSLVMYTSIERALK